jgi:TPR repeat protein
MPPVRLISNSPSANFPSLREVLAMPGDASALYDLGLVYANGQGALRDDTEAARWFRIAADQGYPPAQYALARMYGAGQGVGKDIAQALAWYRKAADQGYAAAQYAIARTYHVGEGTHQDFAEAMKWYRKAAQQGYANAQNDLGVMYETGQGVPQDHAEAVAWYRKAADQGHSRAQNNLGFMYERGRGVAQDSAQAVNWYRSAAEQGLPRAQLNLGVMSQCGDGVAQDSAEALKWRVDAAARHGIAIAQNNLGYLHERGGSRRIMPSGAWYRKAAEQGYAHAQNNLGVLYESGQGVARDYAGRAWFRKRRTRDSPSPNTTGRHVRDRPGRAQGLRRRASGSTRPPIRQRERPVQPGGPLRARLRRCAGLCGSGDVVSQGADQGTRCAAQSRHHVLRLGAAAGLRKAHVLNLATSAPSFRRRSARRQNRDIVANKMTPSQVADAQSLAQVAAEAIGAQRSSLPTSSNATQLRSDVTSLLRVNH